MARSYTVKKNSKKKSKANGKKALLVVFSAIVLVSIVCTLLFGLKIYAYGKDVTVVYVTNGGDVGQDMQVVEVCKSYTLQTPYRSGYEFAYWSTEPDGSRRVSNSGIWTVSTKSQVVLYAIWQGYNNDGEHWTGNY